MVVVAAIDSSPTSRAVVEEASELAEAFDVPLHLFHVVKRARYQEVIEGSAAKHETVDEDVIDDLAAEAIETATEGLSAEYDVETRLGTDIADEILEYGNETDARYFVVGGRKRSPVGKALVGSVSQSVILKADRPTVVVKYEHDEADE